MTSNLEIVGRIHGEDVAAWMADHHPAAMYLLADGWTIEAALNHLSGHCDRMACTGAHLGDAVEWRATDGRWHYGTVVDVFPNGHLTVHLTTGRSMTVYPSTPVRPVQ